MKLKLAILCSDGPHHLFLVETLRLHFQVVTVIEEPAKAQRRKLARRHRWADYWWWTYHAWRRKLLGFDRYRAAFFLGTSAALCRKNKNCTTVDDINCGLVKEILQRDGHNLTVVMGTSVLRKDLLRITGKPTLNVHGGYLPFYRGNHCFFFALYDGRVDRVGSTIHLVNEGVDTGDIIQRIPVQPRPNEHPEELYCRAEREAVAQLTGVLKEVEAGSELRGTRQIGNGRTYRMRDRKPWHDLKMWLRGRQPRFRPWLFKPNIRHQKDTQVDSFLPV